jgi:hypothetical protein
MTMADLRAPVVAVQRPCESAESQTWVADGSLVTREVVVTRNSPRLDGGHFDHLINNRNVRRPLEVLKTGGSPGLGSRRRSQPDWAQGP